MTMFSFGEYVVYDSGYKVQIGRVAQPGITGSHVCFHHGCTAAFTDNGYLRPATDEEIAQAEHGIGYHRFDDECQDFCEEACLFGTCRAAMNVVYNNSMTSSDV